MKKGLTLVELLIVVVFIGLLGAVVVFVYMAGLKSWTAGRNYVEVTDTGGLVMEKMVRELSMASEITSAESDEVKFEADIYGTGSEETIKYDVDRNGDLIRTTGTGGDKEELVLVENVQGFTLGYYLDLDDTKHDSVKATGKSPTEADGIRVVVISLSLGEGDETIALSNSVYTRNQGLDDE
jgi:hypothetical protein